METALIYNVATELKNSNYRTSLLTIYPEFIALVKVLPYRNIIVVKPRDLCMYMGACDHYKLTCLGRLLSFLEKQGLARRHNNSRPRRYTLSKVFRFVKQFCRIDVEGEDYCVDHGCSLLGLCPYWLIKRAGEARWK